MNTPGFELKAEDFGKLLKKSSFAAGALLLTRQRRRDFEIYYAFCRSVDDCADEYRPAQGRVFLKRWEAELARKPGFKSPLLVRELHRISIEYQIPLNLHRELIAGALSDLRAKVRFSTPQALDVYCHLVAGVVGQACLPLFGLEPHEAEQAKDYAETLGRAFQLINILRDAGEDASKNRIYFALSDLKRHGVSEKDFLAGQRLKPLLREYGDRAAAALAAADSSASRLPKAGIRPSRMMRLLYGALLEQMRQDDFKVFEKRHKLSALKKSWIVFKALL